MSNESFHILIVDDEHDITVPLRTYLEKYGHTISVAHDGEQMDRLLARRNVDLLVLDIMLPNEDGLSICRRLNQDFAIPIIMLSALDEEADKVVGLEIGADDYLTKPFNPRELLARIKSVIRRTKTIPANRRVATGKLKFDRWKMELSQKELIDDNEVLVRLSTREHTLLVTLIEHAGITLSRDQLLNLTKGQEAKAFDRSIDNQISRLRQKIEADPKNPRIIVTNRGGGYAFVAELENLS